MGTSSFFRFSGKTWFALALACVMASAGFAQEAKQVREAQAAGAMDCCAEEPADYEVKVFELNQLTGKTTIQAKLKSLAADPAECKKLIAAGLPLAKRKNRQLNYTAALMLARIARLQKDLPACEVFYKLCMQDASKMMSETMLLESYGGLSDAYFDNRKYSKSAQICKDILEFKVDDRAVIPVTRNEKKDITIAGEPDDNFDPTQRIKSMFIRSFIQATAKSGKVADAVEMIDKLLDANDHWILYQLRGQVLHSAGKYEDAIKSYDDALERVAKDKSLSNEERSELKENFRYIESSIYIDMGKTDKAVEILDKLLEAKPNNAGYLNDLGYILADSGQRLKEAEKMIRKAIDIERERRKKDSDVAPDDDHDSGAYLDSLGWALFKQKKYEKAKEVMLKAVEDKTTQHIEIYDHLGDVLEALGDHDGAVAAWRKGVEVASDSRRDVERKAIVQKKIHKEEE